MHSPAKWSPGTIFDSIVRQSISFLWIPPQVTNSLGTTFGRPFDLTSELFTISLDERFPVGSLSFGPIRYLEPLHTLKLTNIVRDDC